MTRLGLWAWERLSHRGNKRQMCASYLRGAGWVSVCTAASREVVQAGPGDSTREAVLAHSQLQSRKAPLKERGSATDRETRNQDQNLRSRACLWHSRIKNQQWTWFFPPIPSVDWIPRETVLCSKVKKYCAFPSNNLFFFQALWFSLFPTCRVSKKRSLKWSCLVLATLLAGVEIDQTNAKFLHYYYYG